MTGYGPITNSPHRTLSATAIYAEKNNASDTWNTDNTDNTNNTDNTDNTDNTVRCKDTLGPGLRSQEGVWFNSVFKFSEGMKIIM